MFIVHFVHTVGAITPEVSKSGKGQFSVAVWCFDVTILPILSSLHLLHDQDFIISFPNR